MTTEFKSNLANLAEQLQAVYALFRNATSDDEREAVYRMAGIDLLNMRVELLAALSTAADAERLKAENERMRQALEALAPMACDCGAIARRALSDQQESRNGQ